MQTASKLRAALAAIALSLIGATAFAQDKITVPSETAIPAADIPADAVVVEIDKLKYQTPELTVAPGTTVYWVNKEAMPHNVAFKKGVVGEADFKGVMLKRDEAYSITFNEAGGYDYHCTPHPFMRAKVTVE